MFLSIVDRAKQKLCESTSIRLFLRSSKRYEREKLQRPRQITKLNKITDESISLVRLDFCVDLDCYYFTVDLGFIGDVLHDHDLQDDQLKPI